MYSQITSTRRLSSDHVMAIQNACEEKSIELRKIVQDLCTMLLGRYKNLGDSIIDTDDMKALLPIIKRNSTVQSREILIQFRGRFLEIMSTAGIILPYGIRFITMLTFLNQKFHVRRKIVIRYPYASDSESLEIFWNSGGKKKFEKYISLGKPRNHAMVQSISDFNNKQSLKFGFRIRTITRLGEFKKIGLL